MSSLSGLWQCYEKENSWQGHGLVAAATARGGREDLGKASNDSDKALAEVSLALSRSRAESCSVLFDFIPKSPLLTHTWPSFVLPVKRAEVVISICYLEGENGEWLISFPISGIS